MTHLTARPERGAPRATTLHRRNGRGTYPRATNSSGQPFYGGGQSGSVNNVINTAGVGG